MQITLSLQRSNNVTIDGIQMDEEFEFKVIFEPLFLGINLERLVYKKAATPMTLENKAINQKYIFLISHRNEGADTNYKWVIPTPREKSKMRQ